MTNLYTATIFQVNKKLGYLSTGVFHDHFLTDNSNNSWHHERTFYKKKEIIGSFLNEYYFKERKTGLCFPIMKISKQVGLGYIEDCHNHELHTFVINSDDYDKSKDQYSLKEFAPLIGPSYGVIKPIQSPYEIASYLTLNHNSVILETELLNIISEGENNYQSIKREMTPGIITSKNQELIKQRRLTKKNN